ncbi:hypothetical protein Bca52824_033680 [Brassica carinata]|uniref:Uncharacterized protein n=1 Tax=Brassica carinata TaxID=52824 RepID=A0A8X7SDC1_BRACI|nr:hypothetical protein Bca52824_033680 [Brassica carinata]
MFAAKKSLLMREQEHLCDDPLLIHPGTEDVEDVTPDPNYDLEDIEDGFDDATYRRWMIDSQRKNNSLLKRILKTIAGGCFKGQQEREDEQEQSQLNRPSPRQGTSWRHYQEKSGYRGTGVSLGSPGAGSQTDPPPTSITIVLSI